MPRYVQESSAKLGASTRSVLRFVLYGFALVIWLFGPAQVVVAFLTRENQLVFAIVGTVLTVGAIPLGLLVWRTGSRPVADTRRLDRVGVPATVEILAVCDADLSGLPGIELRLRVSGPGFQPFEVTVECRDEAELRVGARLAARVDPADRLFMILR
jgi:hypothetical protein